MESLVAIELDIWDECEKRTPFGLAGNRLELMSGVFLSFFDGLNIAGFVAGVAGIVTGHPLDTVRV